MLTSWAAKLKGLQGGWPEFLQSFGKGSATTVGLDIGSSVMKGVKLVRKEGRLELLQLEKTEIPPGTAPSRQGRLLQQLVRQLDIREANVITAVGGSGCVLRSVVMPKMSPQELRNAFSFEAEKYIPFKPEDAFLDFAILGNRTDGRMEVLLAAAKKELVNNHLELLKKAGLSPDAVDLEMVALANAWEVSHPGEASGAVALLDIGAEGTISVFLLGSQLQFSRQISIGGSNFSQALSQSLQVDLSEAERIKCEPGSRSQDVEAALIPAWEEWLTQCRVSFDFYENQFGRGVERLVLSGGSARLAGFKKWVENAAGLPVIEWNPLAGIASRTDLKTAHQPDPSFGVALGLAVHGTKG